MRPIDKCFSSPTNPCPNSRNNLNLHTNLTTITLKNSIITRFTSHTQMPSSAASTTEQTHTVWRVRLASAFRTILACSIVACTTMYGPAPVRQLLEYPSFSYVTTILIVSDDATLGDALRGCWHALLATVQVMTLSILSLWVIGPTRVTVGLAAAAVAVNAFVVAVPESTHLMCKRIAFGQIVIVYVGAVVHGAQTGGLMQPIHVASSTALGALASALAMLFPYPHLACCEVNHLHICFHLLLHYFNLALNPTLTINSQIKNLTAILQSHI